MWSWESSTRRISGTFTVSVVLMGWFFRDIGLVGQTWLHWGYYVPVQFWAWLQWTRGGDERTELTVTRLGPAA